MGRVVNIEEIPLKDGIIITVFQSSPKSEIGISRDGTVISQKHFVQSEFSNARKIYRNHQLLGNFHQEKFSDKLEKFLLKIGYPLDPGSSAVSTLSKYLEAQGYPINSDPNLTTWVIVPKPDKAPTGASFKNVFRLVSEEFIHSSFKDYELDVYMTKITPETKEIKFRVDIPPHIYNKCMEDNDVENRPQTKYIESNALSHLHSEMQGYSSQALVISDLVRDSQKSRKMIGIVFNSSESPVRDSYNFSYLGQKINTTFNWFLIYEFDNSHSLGASKKYYTWKKVISKNSSIKKYGDFDGIVDLESKGEKSYLTGKPEGVLIEWTQEREDFLTLLEQKFRNLSTNLNDFLSNLDEKKLDLLIGSSSLNLLN
jgi:hypothetical protein